MSNGHRALLYEEYLDRLIGDFSLWRISAFNRALESSKSKGRILPFVRGLRLSTQLIYVVREILSGTGLTANWGHIVDKDGQFCSRECDVIIHSDGHIRRWNGSSNSVMDFRFIEQDKVICVISCKSFIRSSDIDREYCDDMKKYANKVWLFAECCGPRSINSIRSKASTFGYDKFWYIYLWSEKSGISLNRQDWHDFISEIKKLIS
jgi:hypothetical protein